MPKKTQTTLERDLKMLEMAKGLNRVCQIGVCFCTGKHYVLWDERIQLVCPKHYDLWVDIHLKDFFEPKELKVEEKEDEETEENE